MICINCPQAAVWLFQPGGIEPRPYCNLHLPHAYRGSAAVTPFVIKQAPAAAPAEATPAQ